ncbi:MAG: LysR substrate-binding domain-containing protein [Luteolibacter sp.]
MELRHLRYFVAVADGLSFRKAAEKLGLSRPALSKQIKDLEREIGVRLLERDTVSVSLTKAGELFLRDSHALLDQAERAVQRAREAQNGHRGTLRMGSVGILATEFLPGTLKKFHARFPRCEIDFREMLPPDQLDALTTGALDIAFTYGLDAGAHPGQGSVCIVRSKFGVAVSKNHPWAARTSVKLSEIGDQPLLCVSDGTRSPHREEIERIFHDEGVTPRNFRHIGGIDSCFTLITVDQGISLLPRVLDVASREIVIVPIAAETTNCDFKMWAVWQKASSSPLVQYFTELLQERSAGVPTSLAG